MTYNNIIIREIKPEDNKQIEQVIKTCFIELDLPLEGTAYADAETEKMFEAYKADNETYFVLEHEGEILGGAGIKPLAGLETTVCELQKMYFSSKIRGLGYGKKVFQACLDQAKKIGYKKVYIETILELEAAIHIYKSFGFTHLEKPIGNTGHYSCGVWMIKTL